MIIVEGLVKRYGYVKAVDGVSLRIGSGEVVGLVGPNGAGKTTTMKAILGLVVPDQGSISVDGVDPRLDPRVRRRIGYAPEAPVAPRWATVCGFLEVLASIDGVPRPSRRTAVRRALEEFGAGDFCHRKLGSLSKGQRKRVLLAQALLAERRYYLFDEPFTGLDPEWVAVVRAKITELASDGAGVLVSSHILRELQDIVDRVVVIRSGRTVFEGTPREMAEAAGVGSVALIRSPQAALIARLLEEKRFHVTLAGDKVRVMLPRGVGTRELLSIIASANVEVTGLEYREASIEDAYLKLVRGGDVGV